MEEYFCKKIKNLTPISKILVMAKFRIKTIISAKGMSIKEVAEKMGVAPQTLGNIVNEKNNPNISTLERIAKVLEVPVSSLFTDYLEPNSAIIICPQCGARIDIQTGSSK